ncbi:DegV family protein [Psychromicrobium xiongbiense]|uniref:DegV family protein n=1 Tax=Psychromicrobium xiongbiense TaxID=3051184 RepID=UPI00255461D9|nr:DegV family protein [Psychromicrobium sp. YIM S02556]
MDTRAWLHRLRERLRAVPEGHGPARPATVVRVAVVTDSAASLSVEVLHRYPEGLLTVVPMSVVVNGTVYREGDDDLMEQLSLGLAAGMPVTTSRPSPGQFERAYRVLEEAGFAAVLSIHLSAELSGTVEAARLAAQRVSIPVSVLDSRSVGPAQSLAVEAALEAAARGLGVEEMALLAEERLAGSSVLFYVPSLEQLRRGGRLGAAASWLGTVLAIKPLLAIADGKVVPYERVRSAPRAIARLEDIISQRVVAARTPVRVIVLGFGNETQREEFTARLGRRLAAGIECEHSTVPAVIAAHVGLGVLGVVVATAPAQQGISRDFLTTDG